jgi:hypothetical protein
MAFKILYHEDSLADLEEIFDWSREKHPGHDAPSGRMRKRVQPLPQNGLGSHELNTRPKHELKQLNGAGMMLISRAR